jgi:hypothetical protein
MYLTCLEEQSVVSKKDSLQWQSQLYNMNTWHPRIQARKKYGYRDCVQVLGWYNKM